MNISKKYLFSSISYFDIKKEDAIFAKAILCFVQQANHYFSIRRVI